MCYRVVNGYKYSTTKEHIFHTGIKSHPCKTEYLEMTSLGKLTIKPNYAWDGPSGPTIDTQSFMRGSLIHDAIYQLIRMGHLPERFKTTADLMLRLVCLEDGMSRFRAWYVYHGVRLFGNLSCKWKTQGEEVKYHFVTQGNEEM